MLLAKELGVKELIAKNDSLLVSGQVSGEYQAMDPLLSRYLDFVRTLTVHFSSFKLIHVPREQNLRVDLLSKFASSSQPERQRLAIRETLVTPRVTNVGSDVQVCSVSTDQAIDRIPSLWLTPYL